MPATSSAQTAGSASAIAVFATTGTVGSRVAAEAVARGHEVTGISRRGGEVPGAESPAGDLGDADTVREVAAANDVVVLATVPSRMGGDHEGWLDAVRTALANVGSTRVVMVGGAGSLELPDGTRLVDAPVFPEEYLPEGQTMAAAVNIFRAAPESVDWTFLCPAPVITPGERTGDYRVGQDSPAGDEISAEDFAVALVDELEKLAHQRAASPSRTDEADPLAGTALKANKARAARTRRSARGVQGLATCRWQRGRSWGCYVIGLQVVELVVPAEQMVTCFKSERGFVVFTDKRLIAVNVQGITG